MGPLLNTHTISNIVKSRYSKLLAEGTIKVVLALEEGEKTASEIAKKTGLTLGGVVQKMRILCKEGFVSEKAGIVGGRATKLYSLTPKGKQFAKVLREIVQLISGNTLSS